MKKLLLTLLGALTLCGLSPHPAEAQSTQTVSMDLQLRTADHNVDLKYTNPTVGETLTDWFDAAKTSVAAANGGFTRIENNDFIIEFNYFDPLGDTDEKKSHYTSGSWCSTVKKAPGITIYPGARIRIKLKDASKRITALNIKTSIPNTAFKDNLQLTNIHPVKSFENGGDDKEVATKRYDYTETTSTFSAIGLTGSPIGFTDGVIIELPKTGCKNILNYQGTVFSSVSTNASSGNGALVISGIEAEVMDVADLPKIGTIYGYASSVEEWNSNQWQAPTKSTYDDETVKFRLNGKVIVEFTRYEKAPDGTPTATYDATNHTLGGHKGGSVRAYADPSLKYKGNATTVYAVEYRLNNPFKSDAYSPAYCSSYNLTPGSSITASGNNLYTKYIKKYNDGTKISTTAVNTILAASTDQAAIRKSRSIAILSKSIGLADTTTVTVPVISSGYKYLNPTTVTGSYAPSNDYQVSSNTLPAFVFDEIDLTISTEETTGARAPVSAISSPDGDIAVLQADGSWLFKNAINVTATLDDDRFPEAKLYYMTEGAAFDESKATQVPEDGVITINASCDLNVYAVVTVDGKEIASDPASVKLNKLQSNVVSNYADLVNTDNDGKVVTINFTTRTRFSGRVQRATTPNTLPKYPFAFIYDNEGNPVKILSNHSSTSGDFLSTGPVTTGTSRAMTLFVNPSTALNDDKFIEAGSIVGVCRIVDGHPEIMLTDEISDDQFDYRDFCATKPKTAAEIGMSEEQKTVADEAFAKVYESEELSQEHWGKFVKIHHLSKYNAADSTFVDKAGEGHKVKVMYNSATTANTYPYIFGSSAFYDRNYSTYFTNLKNGIESTKATVGGLVDYRHKTTDLVIHVNQVYYNLSKPVFTATASTNPITERETSDPDADQTFDMASLSGSNVLALSVDLSKGQPQKTQVTLGAMKYFDLNDEEKQITNAQSGKLVDGRYLLKVVATIASTNIQPAQEASSTVAVYDPVNSRPGSYLISDFDKLTPEEIAANPYINILRSAHYKQPYDTDLGKLYPTLMVYTSFSNNENGINTSYFLVREVKRDIEADDEPIIPDDDYPRWRIVKSNTARYSRYWSRKSSSDKNWNSSNRSLLTDADGIDNMIAKIEINPQGNLIYDNSGTSTNFQSYCKITDPVQSSQNQQPFFIDEFSELAAIEDFTDATKANIGKERLNTIVSLPSVKISGENGVYRVNTASSNEITWNILRKGDKDVHTTMIDGGDETSNYSLKAIVLNDGNGGYALEVIELKAGFAKSVAVCDHHDHDTYYKLQNFDGVADGKSVEILGATLVKDEEGNVTTELSSTINIVWNTNADLKEQHLALFQEETATGDKQIQTFNLSGTLLRGEDGSISIDVVEFESVKSYPYHEDYANKFVINDQSWVPWGSVNTNFPYYITAQMSGPKYLKGYYRHAATEEDLATAPSIEFDDSRTAKFAESGYLEFFTCNPGKRGLYPCQPRKFTKSAPFSESVSDVLQQESESGYYHFSGTLRIASVTSHEATIADVDENNQDYDRPFTQYVGMATDGEGRHIRVIFPETDIIPQPGMYVRDFLLRRQNYLGAITGTMYQTLNDRVNLFLSPYNAGTIVTPEPDGEITLPVAELRASIDAADNGRLIRLSDMRIGGNETDGFTITPAGSTEPIRVTNALFWNPGEDVDPEADYCIEGYVMPVKAAANGINVLAETDEEMEFWPLTSEAKRPTDSPELTVTGYESLTDGIYVTVEPITVGTVVNGRDKDAYIQYSTDEGNNWITVTDGEFTIDKTVNLWIRALKPGYLPSETTKLNIRREYYSTEAKITPAAKGGYTEVVIAPATDLAADSYKIYYTTDGTEPTIESALYTAPVECDKAATVRALVVENDKRPGKASDPVAVSVRANDLEISFEKGEGFSTVTIAPKEAKHVDPKAEIRYTTDGTEPTAESALYTAPFEVEAAQNGMTVKAICIEPQKTDGLVATQTVAVEGLRPSCDVAITWREEDGVYYITLTAEAGTIHYSLNGADEKTYDGTPIEYTPATDGTCTVKAYVIEDGKKAGKTATESFQVTGIAGIGADGEADGVSVEGNTIIVPQGAQTFDIAGRRVNPTSLPRGIYIVRLASGKAVKVVVK